MARSSGTWQLGQSGNPNGRPPIQKLLACVMSNADWIALLAKAKNRAMDDNNPQAGKYMDILLERAYGKALQVVEQISPQDGRRLDLRRLSDTQLLDLERLMLVAAVEPEEPFQDADIVEGEIIREDTTQENEGEE